jgi:hypothetical protein|tara:strand:- start:80 stop:370 length:291 start_codon:yes stop_codon:yes gene_type:complete
MKDTSEYLEMAIKNIQDDREITRELLDDVVQYMSKDEQRHREVGITAAKYVETLQRSNEQLVKVASLMQKKETASASLSDFDKNELFDMIKGGSPE